MKAASVYTLLFALAIAIATFVENDFGTTAAQKVIFQSRWFELLLILFCISLLVNIWKQNMFQKKKWATLMFHASIIVILIGSGVTRYFGYEGMMHIRENSASSQFLSAETYLQFVVEKQDKKYQINEPVLFASLGDNSFQQAYNLNGTVIDVEVSDFIPNPTQIMVPADNGKPTVKIVIGGTNGREEYFLQQGSDINIRGQVFDFTNTPSPRAVHIILNEGLPEIKSPRTLTVMQMATQTSDTLVANTYAPLMLRSLYSDGQNSFVFGEYSAAANTKVISGDRKMKSESLGGVAINVTLDGTTKSTMISGQKGVLGRARRLMFDELTVDLAYGSKYIKLPFSIFLKDFQLEKYPGTNSASSYASEVVLVDDRDGLNMDYRIYMNNILDYGGYRFFQSSFDQDELGTYLSVNHDFWGTWISYLGYFLLTLGMIATLFSPDSRFTWLSRKLKGIRLSRTAIIALFLVPGWLIGQIDAPIIPQDHVDEFTKLVVQDHRGRLKPIHTMASEIMRKVSRKTELFGLSAGQVFLGMNLSPDEWIDVPVVKLGAHEKVTQLLGVTGKYASYEDFFDRSGQYKLRDEVRTAHGMNSVDRTVYEKELIKIDERLNIINLVLTQGLLRIYPIENDENNLWVSPAEARSQHGGTNLILNPFIEQFFPLYKSTVYEAMSSGDWTIASQMLSELNGFQKEKGAAVMPSDSRLGAEIFLNKLNVFSRLGKVYGLIGLLLLVVFFTTVFAPNRDLSLIKNVGFWILVVAFVFHIIGLGLRWYVSGRAPWSNGYESMIYIAFTTMLAGLLFTRKSSGGLAATALLASIILMVASLSYLDPEITPLVPVLKSYWLTIHVSLEAGSYGFLMLGAIIGVVNLLLMSFMTKGNQTRVRKNITELTYISEMTLIAGLFMVSIGTYLGGVWANESWGRYWGWDAKETWALVTILVYAFILHMRFVPGLRGNYAFNVASLFGFASVMMTYFGVNYYLSGLHSYAAGDPVPIPTWVYYTALSLAVLSLYAWWRQRRVSLAT